MNELQKTQQVTLYYNKNFNRYKGKISLPFVMKGTGSISIPTSLKEILTDEPNITIPGKVKVDGWHPWFLSVYLKDAEEPLPTDTTHDALLNIHYETTSNPKHKVKVKIIFSQKPSEQEEGYTMN